jgi:hypothetical protein
MANKGVCCAAQAAGDLGKPLIVIVHHKDGTTSQRCGTCEVRPSCTNPQKLVFAFRFIKSLACGLAGAKSCAPTSAGIAQYNAERAKVATTAELTTHGYTIAPGTGAVSFPVYTRPAGSPAPSPYVLPPS